MTTVGTQDGNGPIEENFASEIDERPSEDIVTTKIPVVIRNSNTISQPKEETASSIKIEFTKEESEYEEANTTTISSHEEDGVFSNDMQPQRKRARVPKPRTYLGEEDDSPSLLRKGPSNSAKAAKPIQVLDSGEIDSADVLESDDLVASHLLLLSNAAADGEGEDTPSISSRPGSGRGGRGRRGRGGRGMGAGRGGALLAHGGRGWPDGMSYHDPLAGFDNPNNMSRYRLPGSNATNLLPGRTWTVPPGAKVMNMRTLETEGFSDVYSRNNKSNGKKCLRCFPRCCGGGHRGNGFCGMPLYLGADIELDPGTDMFVSWPTLSLSIACAARPSGYKGQMEMQ